MEGEADPRGLGASQSGPADQVQQPEGGVLAGGGQIDPAAPPSGRQHQGAVLHSQRAGGQVGAGHPQHRPQAAQLVPEGAGLPPALAAAGLLLLAFLMMYGTDSLLQNLTNGIVIALMLLTVLPFLWKK